MIAPLAAAEPPPKVAEPAPAANAAPATMPASVVPLAVPVSFHSVSEHEDTEGHRPVRRRRHHEPAEAPTPLQLVETAAEAAAAPVVEDELPRRSKPRRRRGGNAPAEPLTLIETQLPTEPPSASGESTPPAQ